MKSVSITFVALGFISIFLSFSLPSYQTISIPWYISKPAMSEATYNVQDTLDKYLALKETNSPSYHSFLSDLYYLSGNKDEGQQHLKKAFELDSLAFCKYYIIPIYKYVSQSRPEREMSIPVIIEHDFEYFIELVQISGYKNPKLADKLTTSEIHQDYLKLNMLNIFDQWYRIPTRTFDRERQLIYDNYCQEYLDKFFYSKSFVNTPDARGNINAIILHAENCEWSGRWIKKYYEELVDYSRIKNHLQHYLYRSSCRENEEIRKEVKALIDKL